MNLYNTDIKNLTCSCKDWLKSRKNYSYDDPRRLCKHLISKIDINNLPNSIKIFREDILYFKEQERGFNRNFTSILKIPDSNCIVLYKENYDWMSVFDTNGKRYGVLLSGTGNIYWARKEKPEQYEPIENFFLSDKYLPPTKLLKSEANEIREKAHIQMSFHLGIYENSSKYLVYELSGNSDKLMFATATVFDDKIEVKLYDSSFTLHRNAKLVHEEKEKEKKTFIKNMRRSRERDKQRERELQLSIEKAEAKGHLLESEHHEKSPIFKLPSEQINYHLNKISELREEIDQEYGKTNVLLKEFNSSLNTLTFNKLLKQLKMIVKDPFLNNGDWIIIGEGLKYGINYVKSSKYLHKKIPEWYEVKKIDDLELKLLVVKKREKIPMTIVMWHRKTFEELLHLLSMHKINDNNEIKKKPKLTQRQIEREKWLKDVECPRCGSKNIHKKDKRQRETFQVQRYQCMDCKKVFQEKIEEIPIETENKMEEAKDIKPKSSILKKIFDFITT